MSTTDTLTIFANAAASCPSQARSLRAAERWSERPLQLRRELCDVGVWVWLLRWAELRQWKDKK